LTKGLALEQFGNDIRRAFVLAEVIDRQQVWMVQRGCRVSFLSESAKAVGICRKARRDDLNRDVAAECGITHTIYLTHAASTERCFDLVRTQPTT
jgi:hypothetical protein